MFVAALLSPPDDGGEVVGELLPRFGVGATVVFVPPPPPPPPFPLLGVGGGVVVAVAVFLATAAVARLLSTEASDDFPAEFFAVTVTAYCVVESLVVRVNSRTLLVVMG